LSSSLHRGGVWCLNEGVIEVYSIDFFVASGASLHVIEVTFCMCLAGRRVLM